MSQKRKVIKLTVTEDDVRYYLDSRSELPYHVRDKLSNAVSTQAADILGNQIRWMEAQKVLDEIMHSEGYTTIKNQYMEEFNRIHDAIDELIRRRGECNQVIDKTQHDFISLQLKSRGFEDFGYDMYGLFNYADREAQKEHEAKALKQLIKATGNCPHTEHCCTAKSKYCLGRQGKRAECQHYKGYEASKKQQEAQNVSTPSSSDSNQVSSSNAQTLSV